MEKLETVRKGMTKAQVDAMLPGLYQDGIYTIVNDKNKTWATQLATIQNPGDITGYIKVMKDDAQNEVMLMRTRLANEGVMHTQEAKDAVANFEKDLNASIESLVGVADGKKAAEILKSRADAQATAQKFGILNKYNLAAIDAFKDIYPLLPDDGKCRHEGCNCTKFTTFELRLLKKKKTVTDIKFLEEKDVKDDSVSWNCLYVNKYKNA